MLPMNRNAVPRSPGRRSSALAQLILCAKQDRYWWLLPTILALILVAGLLIAESRATAPFVYTAF